MRFDDTDIDEICAALEARGYLSAHEVPDGPDPDLVASLESQERIAEIHAEADVAIAELHTEAATETAEAIADVAIAEAVEADAEAREAEAMADEAEAEAVEAVAEATTEHHETPAEEMETVLDTDNEPVSVEAVTEDSAPRRAHWFHRKLV